MNDIDGYISALSLRLLPLGKARRDILTEVRSHLEEARDYYISQGNDHHAAVEKAIGDFGPVSEVSRGYIAVHPVAWSWILMLTLLSVPIAALTIPYGPLSNISLIALPLLYVYLFIAGSYTPFRGSAVIGLVAGVSRAAVLYTLAYMACAWPQPGENAVFLVTTALIAVAPVIGSVLVRRYDRE